MAKQSVARRAARPQLPAGSLAENCAVKSDSGDDGAAKLELTIERKARTASFWSRFRLPLAFLSCAFSMSCRSAMYARCTAARLPDFALQ